MRLVEIQNSVGNCRVVKEGEFEQLALIGKNFDKDKLSITFLSDKTFIEMFLRSDFAGVICTEEIYREIKSIYSGGICISEQPKIIFFSLHNYLVFEAKHSRNILKAQIGENSAIHKTAVISNDNVCIGNNVCVGANAVVKGNVTIGNNVNIGEGCVIGSSGFYYFGEGDKKRLVESAGVVIVEDNVDIHPNSTVCKGVLYGETRLGKNSKYASNILIEHNCIIGENCMLAGGTTLAGGVGIGEDTFLGMNVVVSPNVQIGSRVKGSAGAVITKNVPDGMQVSGNFAIEHSAYIEHVRFIDRNSSKGDEDDKI